MQDENALAQADQSSSRDESVTTTVSLQRGFIASLKWLVAEGDARGVARMAIELRALRDALTTLDETRAARDEQAKRATELDREIQAALAMLGPATAVDGNGTIVQRLMKLREKLADDSKSRRQLTVERDAWRAMCTLLTQTRARVHELLEDAEQEREALSSSLDTMRDRIVELSVMHNDARDDGDRARTELSELRAKLATWSETVESTLKELAGRTSATFKE